MLKTVSGGVMRHTGVFKSLSALLCVAMHLGAAHALSKMQLAHTWGAVDFVFSSQQQLRQLEASGVYKQGSAVPFDVDVDPRSGRIFLALPMVALGSAVTLATIENPRQVQSPRLVPYPDWSWHAGARGCDGLTSVFRIQIDRCGRLWAVDSGVADITGGFVRRCPPQLFVFDLATNRQLLRHRFDVPKATCDDALLLNVVVELPGGSCADAFAYAADAGASALFVYSLRANRSWRVEHDLFSADVNARTFRVAGTTMNLMDGLVGLAVSPAAGRGAKGDAPCENHLLFHALSSFQEGRVCTSVLRNASLFADGETGPDEAFAFIGRRGGQSSAESSTKDGVLFFSEVNRNTINCWNQRKKYANPNLPAVEKDDAVIRFVTGLKVISGPQEQEEVWAISNNAQLLFTDTFRPNVNGTINIIRGNAQTLIKGVNC